MNIPGSHGFIPPVIIELKLLHNPEILHKTKRPAYKRKLKQYLRSQNAVFGIYLVFKVKEGNRDDHKFEEMRREYEDLEGWIIPDFIDCTIPFQS